MSVECPSWYIYRSVLSVGENLRAFSCLRPKGLVQIVEVDVQVATKHASRVGVQTLESCISKAHAEQAEVGNTSHAGIRSGGVDSCNFPSGDSGM